MATNSPHAIVTVNGLQSVCDGDCAYAFASSTPEVTSQTISGNVVSIQMTNPLNIPATTDWLTIWIVDQTCTFVSVTFTDVQCELPTNADGSVKLAAGDYDAVVKMI